MQWRVWAAGLIALLWGAVLMAQSSSATLCFDDAVKQQQFTTLVKEMRCVTCPNQSIADSQAPIAVAMKEEIYRRLARGDSEQAIRDYLFSQYGEYISYKPPVQKETWALWWGPIAMLIVGISIWSAFLYRRRQ